MAQRQRPMMAAGRVSQPFALRCLLSGDFGSPLSGPGVGDAAPDFTLMTHDGGTQVTLSQYRRGRPAVLVFGSITCGVTRSRFEPLEDLYRRFGNDVAFLSIYVRETHATDGTRARYNDQAGIAVPQPREQSERNAVAEQCCSRLGITMPMLVDGMQDQVSDAYSAIPNRLYLIDRDGRVAYRSARGPFGFIPGELAQSLLLLLWDEAPARAASVPAG
jgi:hypothetical protein